MFSFNKNKSKPSIQEEQVTQFSPVDVYTPPARFLPSSGSGDSTKKGGNTITIILIILFVVIIAGGIGAWVFFGNKSNVDPNLQQPGIAPLDLTTEDDTEQNKQVDPVISVPLQPITYVAKDGVGNVNGILTLQLSVADKSFMDQIVITSDDPSSTTQYVIGNAYVISPRGSGLSENARLTIEYFDTTLSSNIENSLRIAFLSSTGEWQLDEKTEIDLSRNQVSIDIVQLPSTQVAVVSNLTTGEINLSKDSDIEKTKDFETQSLVASFDADSDGLSDMEELLFGTDVNRPDSDLDGYTDGEEVFNLFSPSQAGVSLIDSEQFTLYTNPVFGYTLQYPSSWTVNAINIDSNIMMFNSATNQFVEVIIEKLDVGINTIQEWYQSQVPGLNIEDIRSTSVGSDDYFAIKSIDGATVYFIVDEFVVGIVYNKGIETEADYLMIYNAMKNSWSWPATIETTIESNVVDEEVAESVQPLQAQ